MEGHEVHEGKIILTGFVRAFLKLRVGAWKSRSVISALF
jgi:hypothetical protein